MGAGLLELAGPDDVRLFVGAGLDLDQDDDLFALLGGPDEIADDRRIARCPVDGHLDRQHLGIPDGLGDEPFDRCGEALVGMMDEQVAGADDRIDVGSLVLVRRHEAGGRHRRPRRALQVRSIELRDHPQSGEIQHAPDVVAVVLAEADPAEEDLAGSRRHRAFDLESDGLAEAAPAELLLDGQEEIVGLVLFDRQVGVAGDPEEMVLEDFHAAEQDIEVRLDDLVEEDEVVRLDLDEARQDRRDLDAGKMSLAGLGVAEADGDRQAEGRDVREWVARIHGERGEHGVDLVEEPLAEGHVVLRDRGVVQDLDALGGERAANLRVQPAQILDEAQHSSPRGGQLFRSRSAVRRDCDRTCVDLLAEAGDPDLEELVQHAGEDRQEPDPLDQRVPPVARLEHDAVDVLEPGQLAIDVRRARRRAGGGPGRGPRTWTCRADVTVVDGGHGLVVTP